MENLLLVKCLIDTLQKFGFFGSYNESKNEIMVYNKNKYKVNIHYEENIIQVSEWRNAEQGQKADYYTIYVINSDGVEQDYDNGQ